MKDSKDILTIKEAASLLRVHKITIYRHIQAGKILVIRIGRALRISKTELLKSSALIPTSDKKSNLKDRSKQSYTINDTDSLYLLSKMTKDA